MDITFSLAQESSAKHFRKPGCKISIEEKDLRARATKSAEPEDAAKGETQAVPPLVDKTRTQGFRGGVPEEMQLGDVGPYNLVNFLGKGGAGIVYLARDPDGAELALKVLVANPLIQDDEIQRFLAEAETSKRLRKHPNIITVYDTGQDGANYYIAMELAPGGRTIEDLIGKNLPVKEILEYAIPVARALEFAHQEGILHRDLKPANILINEFNQPLLADFGLARAEGAQKLTMTGTVMGTPRYMSPEQCGFGDGVVANQTDIYSFGLILYELLTGVLPYSITQEMSLAETFRTICREEPMRPRKLRKDIGRNLEAVVLRMLEKEKKLRYADISQVRSDLEACLAGEQVSVRHLTIAEKWEKWIRKNSAQAITAGIAIAAGAGVFAFVFMPQIKEKTYAKQDSDLAAVAAKRKAQKLEKELEAIRNPHNVSLEDVQETGKFIKAARELLAQEKFDQAQKEFESLLKWAKKAGHTGMEIESEFNLARIALVKGYATKAFDIYDRVALSSGWNTEYGRLASFESGVAKWRQGQKDEARKIWRGIAENKGSAGEEGIDNGASPAYIQILAGGMLESGLEKPAESFPAAFRGLAYWVMAQNAQDSAHKADLLAKAAENKGQFVWIGKKEEK